MTNFNLDANNLQNVENMYLDPACILCFFKHTIKTLSNCACSKKKKNTNKLILLNISFNNEKKILSKKRSNFFYIYVQIVK